MSINEISLQYNKQVIRLCCKNERFLNFLIPVCKLLHVIYTVSICCFSAKHAALKSQSKDWLARNQDNVSDRSDISPHGLLIQ